MYWFDSCVKETSIPLEFPGSALAPTPVGAGVSANGVACDEELGLVELW
jgi:hypothetical protein